MTDERASREAAFRRKVRAVAAPQEDAEDWPALALLLAGVALAIAANTFVGLLPG